MALTKEEAILKSREFLSKNILCVISTVTSDCKPEAAVSVYMTDENFNFYFITRESTRKFANLKKNHNVAIVVGLEPAPFTVQAEGEATYVSGEARDIFMREFAKRRDLQALYTGPFLNMPGLDFAIFKVDIKWLRYMELDTATQKESYYQLIP
jgi:uncharacterized pyridoxamine 5'-phosphate oxidase family protein